MDSIDFIALLLVGYIFYVFQDKLPYEFALGSFLGILFNISPEIIKIIIVITLITITSVVYILKEIALGIVDNLERNDYPHE